MKKLIKHRFFRIIVLAAILLSLPAAYYGLLVIKQSKNRVQVNHTAVGIKQNMLDIHHWVSPDGTKVAFVPLHELPIIDIHIVYAAGSAYDGEKFGSAQLTSQLIGEDTTDMTSDVIHDAFESVGAIFNVDIEIDAFGITLRSMSEPTYRVPAIHMLETILGKTTFTQPAFEREKNTLLTTITSNKQDPQATISNAFYGALYGKHPYGHPDEGTTESVTALSLQDIQHFHQTYLVKQNAIIAITGDLRLEEAQAIATQLIAAMPSGNPAPAIPPIPDAVSNHHVVPFPSSQTHLMMGISTIAKGSPDFYALSVGNQVLGVTPLVNRLFNAVRVQQGLAYSVGSSLSTFKQPGPFTIYLQSRAAQADKALTVVNQTLSAYLQNGPTEAELQAAKDNLTGQFVLALSNNAAINSHLATIAFYDLPWDYANHYQAKINAVTLEQVKDVFSRYIHPNEFTLIQLGEHP